MSRHSEGQHIRKLHKIVSVADGKLSQAGSAEESPPNNGRQSGQREETDKRSHQIRASNGIKAENLEIRGSKQEKGHFVAESSTDRDIYTNTHCHEGVGHNIERLKKVVKRRLLKPSKARKSLNTGLRISNSVNDLPSYTLTLGPAGSQCRGSNPERQCNAYEAEVRYSYLNF
jgi:hypothetical protein